MDSQKSVTAVRGYDARVASEIDIYRECTDVHNLPPIFHYWSDRHLRPKLEQRGFKDPAEMFLVMLRRQCAQHPDSKVRILSAGSGNCELEVGVAAGLRQSGFDDFVIECVDLNPSMLHRGALLAGERGVAANLAFVDADLNRWNAPREYHAVIADQSLHHVMELESLFRQIRQSLRPDGIFVISDMIGRNGHLRWPESLAIVREFWRKLPPSYRRNCRSGRYEAVFEDADCSTESFEGIRAQDIVPVLGEFFHFQFFLGFGNVIDPFVDRSFGPNFDPQAVWDRDFIDQVHRRDEEEMASGHLQPTHMLAVLGRQAGATSTFGHTAPPRVHISSAESYAVEPTGGYAWGSWPHTAETQLDGVCRMVESAESRVKALEKELATAIAQAQQREIEFEARTAWALRLDHQLNVATLQAVEREADLDDRTAWARKLEAQLAARTAWAMSLDNELAERTEWALRLDRELTARNRAAESLGMAGYLRRPVRFARWLLATWLPGNVFGRSPDSERTAPPPSG